MTEPAPQPRRLDTIEKSSKILAAVLIPVVIAWMGFRIDDRINDRNLSRDYVEMAVGILTSQEEVDSALIGWAVDLLNENAPTKMAPEVIERLKSGEAIFPSSESAYALMEENDLRGAVDAWSERIKADRNDYFSYFHRSTAYRRQGQLDSALADLDTVIALAPNHRGAFNNRGMIKAARGDIEAACVDFRKAAELGNRTAVGNIQRYCR